MAQPNIVNVTTIIGNTSLQALTSNANFTLVNNPANSNAVYKVNTIIVANRDSTNAITINVSAYSGANITGSVFPIGIIAIPTNSTLTLLDKTTAIYLQENQSIGANCTSAVANNLSIITSWEQIS